MYAILYLQIKYSIAELTFCFTSDAKLNDKIIEKLYKALDLRSQSIVKFLSNNGEIKQLL